MYALVIKALKVRPVVRRKVWLHYQISATWTWRVTTTIFFITWLVIQWQCGSVVWEPRIPLASVLSCSVVCAKSGKEKVRLSRWSHSSCTVESRIDRAENAMWLGWSHPRSPGDGQFGQENVQERSGAGRAPGTATRIELVPRLLRMLVCVLDTKNIFVSNQRPARIYRTAFVIFLHKGVDLQTRLLLLRPVLDL